VGRDATPGEEKIKKSWKREASEGEPRTVESAAYSRGSDGREVMGQGNTHDEIADTTRSKRSLWENVAMRSEG